MGYKITRKKFTEAVKGSLGLITTVAAKMQVERTSVYKFLEREPDLRHLLEIERDKIVDRAESVLFEKVNDKNWKAVEFALKFLGGKRGYATKEVQEHHESGSPTGEDFARLWKKTKDKEKLENNSPN